MQVQVKGAAEMERKLALIPESVKAGARAANEQNGLEFMRQVLAIIPEESGKLAHTLAKEEGRTPLGVRITIGGIDAPYPAHLEFGHRTPGGKHVPAKPFWFSSLRVLRRRFKSRVSYQVSKAIKALRPVDPS